LNEMIWKVVFLGILQGFLEWLPISSRGNLVLLMIHVLGMGGVEALNLSIYLHMGTLLAVLAYFRRDFVSLAMSLPNYRFRYSNEMSSLISFLLFSSIVSGSVGYFILKLAETSLMTGEYLTAIIGVSLVATGLLQKYVRKHEKRKIEDVKSSDTLLLGIAQGFSVFPGISRSGITISALIFREFKSEAATKLSFLMSVPAVLMAEVGSVITGGVISVGITDIFLGCFSSFLTGLISIHILIKAAEKIRFWGFCVLIGVLALLPTFSYLL